MPVELSRRNFLKVAGAAGLAAVLPQYGEPVVSAAPVINQPPSELVTPLAAKIEQTQSSPESALIKTTHFRKHSSYPIDLLSPLILGNTKVLEALSSFSDRICLGLGAPKGSYRETAIQNLLALAAQLSMVAVLSESNIPNGNQSTQKEDFKDMLINQPAWTFLQASVLAPVTEEVIFRGTPSWFVDTLGGEGKYWRVGAPSSILFGLAHNITLDENKAAVFVPSIPASQVSGGLFEWYLMREKGFSHALLAHSMTNTIAVTMLQLAYRTKS